MEMLEEQEKIVSESASPSVRFLHVSGGVLAADAVDKLLQP